MKTVAFIPAKDISERLPGKNMRLLNGMPMFYWSVKYAQAHGLFPIITTQPNSEVSMWLRTREVGEYLCYETSVKGIIEEAKAAAKHFGFAQPDRKWVLLQPSSPIRKPGLVNELLQHANAFTSQKIKLVGTYNGKSKFQGDAQTATEWFHHWDGNMLAGTMEGLMRVRDGNVMVDNIIPVEEGMPFNLQVDTKTDWDTVEAIVTKYPELLTELTPPCLSL